ncbi:hypothetical protein [Paraburkholderia kirstenboschensis]|uniref:Uncharacterized protein n=1 Tax=Paraburkholderia kirstenboschensis TaxID=1245436 RepID=A0ABZ0EIF6_9BURK|nr:hypothetical protein [Paraburkholderia kirstenboschensis]WOD16976.1 hypothetical protein RW095_14045 [Paraburkholderia kirstenboschensis]
MGDKASGDVATGVLRRHWLQRQERIAHDVVVDNVSNFVTAGIRSMKFHEDFDIDPEETFDIGRTPSSQKQTPAGNQVFE